MKQAILENPGKIRVIEDPEPSPTADEVLVKVHYCGICGSDIHSFRGTHPFVTYPIIPGHEFSGTVLETGSGVSGIKPGDKVAIEPSLYCGTCPRCVSGRYNICDNLKVMGFQAPGAFRELISVPAHRVHILPPGLNYRSGALTEPAAVGVHALSLSRAQKGWILIIGGGVIGLMLLKVAKSHGLNVAVIEANEELAERALSFGADSVAVFAGERAVPEYIGEKPEEFQAVFECVGLPDTASLAIRSAPRGSRVVLVGVFGGPGSVPLELIQDGELMVLGSLMYTGNDFSKAISLISAGEIKPESFITHIFPLEEIESAFLAAQDRSKALKVVVEISRH